MGTQSSLPERESTPDLFWPTAIQTSSVEESVEASGQERTVRHEDNQKKLEVFKQELAGKREARHKAIVALTDKIKQLQSQIKTEQDGRIAAEEEIERLKELLAEGGMKTELDKVRQRINDLEEKLEEERREKEELLECKEKLEEKEDQIRALREVASIGKEMLRIRELQVNELKKKLYEAAYPGDLREQYELQIQNVRRLKTLYEERAEAARSEHQKELEREQTKVDLLEKKLAELEQERKESELMKEHLKSQVLKLDLALEEQNDNAMTLREKLDTSVLECKDLSSQMALINNLFSHVLLGNFDVDRLTRLLQENHSLMTDLTSSGQKNDLAALLLNIAGQVDHQVEAVTEPTEPESENSGMTQEEVALNLSKVWRILIQLLAKDGTSPSDCDSESCYKSVDTPSGPRSVISVSQTFLTLKTLILEKNALIKELTRLKSLNTHLETRLEGQEKRLSIVSTELKKTWGVVSKLRAQHKQLHTQEKILRYELKHKRHLLNELKEELERCRDKWDLARKKNSQSEEDWRKLRREFADRKNRQVSNSAESGYEDDESHSPPTEESMDEHEDETEINSPVQSDEITEQEELDFNDPGFINILKDEDDIDKLNATEQEDNIDNNLTLLECTENSELNNSKTSSQTSLEEQDEKCCTVETPSDITDVQRLQTDNIPAENVENNEKCQRSHGEDYHLPTVSEECLSRLKPQEGVSTDDESSSETSPSPSTINGTPVVIKSTKITRTSHSVENITRFLDGLITPNRDEPDSNHESTSSNHPPEHDSGQEYSQRMEQTEKPPVERHSQFISDIISSNEEDETDITRNPLPDIAQATTSCTTFINSEKEEETRAEIRHHVIEEKTDTCRQETTSSGYETLPDVAQSSAILEIPTNNENDSFGVHETNSYDRLSANESKEKHTVESGCTASATHESISSVVSDSHPSQEKPVDKRSAKEVLDARTERLKRLEEQCKSLFNKVTATTHKSNALSTKLEMLHEHYGGNYSGSPASSGSRSSRTEMSDSGEAMATSVESCENVIDKSKP